MDQIEAGLVLDRWIGPPADAPVGPDTPTWSPSGGLAVRLDQVTRRYDSRTVLNRLSLDIEPGSFVSVVGRSGEGKSTLLRLLSGLDHPQGGSVRLDGRVVGGLCHDVTMMFQDSRLLPWETVAGNVGIARGPGWRDQARTVLRQVGLAERGDDRPARLSGGQRQRVALARALMNSPGLLLLDEPLGALDALTRADMQRLIERIWQKAGFTAVLVTHDVGEAVALSDRVLVLRAGRIALDIAVELPRPRHRATAETAALEQQILEALLA